MMLKVYFFIERHVKFSESHINFILFPLPGDWISRRRAWGEKAMEETECKREEEMEEKK